ncbi:hypothetical protein P7I26_16340 [Enterococcus casseliflavus]|uniref:hypothetical protein n=1 Tax=Enterococcus casseliflavus TaxID=37734 RepID=UPI002891F458|nr:hypothetical protein [Enterococcus casseliflavus]MDT2987792.1 hypothetical protein [Enterococcus casseliflavus]
MSRCVYLETVKEVPVEIIEKELHEGDIFKVYLTSQNKSLPEKFFGKIIKVTEMKIKYNYIANANSFGKENNITSIKTLIYRQNKLTGSPTTESQKYIRQ